MTIETTSTLTNAIKAQYVAEYVGMAMANRLYDQLAVAAGKDMANLAKGSSVNWNFLASLPISTATISESIDVTPRTAQDGTVSLTTTSRRDAIKWSEALDLHAYTDYGASRFKLIGKQMAQSVDYLAMSAACQGKLFQRTKSTRATLDAGTTTDRLTSTQFANANTLLNAMGAPMYATFRGPRGMAIMHPFAYEDLVLSSKVVDVATYQNAGILFNFELGELNGFSCVVDAGAKVFWAAGTAHAGPIATTTGSAIKALDTTIVVSATTNMAAGCRILLGTIETGDTFYETNESVIITYVDGSSINVVGEGENGGCKFAHDSGVTVSNADSAFPVVFGGRESLVKLYDIATGEYGKTVGPKVDGILEQWASLGWKFYGGYGRIAENRIMRQEVASSVDAA